MGAGKGQFCLRRFSHTDLVEARDSIHKPFVLRATKGVSNSFVTARDGHRNDLGDQVERDVIDTEAPDKVIDVSDIFLMKFRCNQRLREPFSFGFVWYGLF